MNIRIGSEEDLDMLAAMNKQLIEDERHDNPMDIPQLRERMQSFIEGSYAAYIFEAEDTVLGYALVDHSRSPLYLRQFFISRSSRGQGNGKAAFRALTQFLGTDDLDIEVMHWNEQGYRFWKSLGFQERSVYMRRSHSFDSVSDKTNVSGDD
ncbi:GNAT family N-acetyltransferase [Paenibacillus sp. PR3]|uniref:GNAT family N-acetyltransferase n=1 Tax=Paenibacillus terricola TaxID=2763503 RepID=A0ABR8MPF4_9BACL|nr:GNAT family N-acetyltransferase [Paenibacillus terricola]MBD3917873.1 GNAT family N-acetyltransferase [Paenibacillus terricola]